MGNSRQKQNTNKSSKGTFYLRQFNQHMRCHGIPVSKSSNILLDEPLLDMCLFSTQHGKYNVK